MTRDGIGPVVLHAEEVTVRYAGVCANDAVSLTARVGEIVGLIGPNGAGKTTFVDALTGFAASTGAVRLDGRALEGVAPHRRSRLGMARTWQSLELFPDLTVRENVRVADDELTWRSVLLDLARPARPKHPRSTDRVLALLDLADVAEDPPDRLPLGLRKRVSIARALASSPRVVLLDEPAAGLNPTESAQLATTIRRVAAEGIAVVLIDHDMDLVLGLCDRVYVLEMGTVIAEGRPEVVRRDQRVVAAYLGTPAAAGHDASADGRPDGTPR